MHDDFRDAISPALNGQSYWKTKLLLRIIFSLLSFRVTRNLIIIVSAWCDFSCIERTKLLLYFYYIKFYNCYECSNYGTLLSFRRTRNQVIIALSWCDFSVVERTKLPLYFHYINFVTVTNVQILELFCHFEGREIS